MACKVQLNWTLLLFYETETSGFRQLKQKKRDVNDSNVSCDVGATLFSIFFIYLLYAYNQKTHFKHWAHGLQVL